MPRKQVVTLTTDFGTSDHFVGVMKGVIININPDVELVDLCHNVNSYDVFDAAFTLAQSYRYFPSDTIHLVVIDPGVGTARRPILVRTMEYKFVAPDNGVLSLIYEREESVEVRHITADHYFLNPVSNTFHARDIFAPVVGWLSKGVEVDKFGDPITDYAKFASPKPKHICDISLAEALMEGVRGNAVAALAASLANRLGRAALTAGSGAPQFLQLQASAGSLLVAPAPNAMLLVVVADADINVGLARLEMLRAAEAVA